MSKYKFSVIIPIYNMEEYLEDSIKSIINQTIGFENNIQLILVNDGSTDRSEEICLKYKEKYMNNIIYIKQKNGGVSAARNKGLEEVQGEFVNFLDSDDKWSTTSFEEVYLKTIDHPDINIFACKLNFFDAAKGDHPLNYKFKKDKIVNMFEDYKYPQLSCCSVFFRYSSIDETRFDKAIKYAEDSVFFSSILFKEHKYMLIKKPTYYYRRRQDNSSAIQNQTLDKDYYLISPFKSFKKQMEDSKEKFGEVVKYVQGVVLYDLYWRVFLKNLYVLNKKEEKEYMTILKYLLDNIDDEVIYNYGTYSYSKKLSVFNYKYSNKLKIEKLKNNLLIEEKYLFPLEPFFPEISTMNINGDTLEIYGIGYAFMKDIYLYSKNKNYKMEQYELDEKNSKEYIVDEKYALQKKGFKTTIQLNEFKNFYFGYKNNSEIIPMGIKFKNRAPLNNTFASLYLRTDNYFVKYNKKKNQIDIFKKNIFNKIKLGFKYYLNAIKKKKIKVIIIRVLSDFYSILNKKEIWILSDRLNIAGDNGEVFFSYLLNRKDNRKYFYTISKTSGDYKRLKEKYGKNIVEYESFIYKILFLNSSKIISAHADEYVINPFGSSRIYLSDRFNYKYIFLQHGIIKNDLSPWLNINNINMDIFITAAKKEYESLLNFRYNYPEKVIKLTGLARYDWLKNNTNTKNKTIILMPTWRRSLAEKSDLKTGVREYNYNFKKSDYFKFYNSLINNNKLLKALKKNNYVLRFIPHNNMLAQIKDFDIKDNVEIVVENVSYREEFNNNSLLITDFSSVSFDFAYLKKPVVYAQFDSEKFYKEQIYKKGYFNYEKDGFGPVCENLEDTVDSIIKYIESGCKMEKKYMDRVYKFFKYSDNKNCERIYNAILELDINKRR